MRTFSSTWTALLGADEHGYRSPYRRTWSWANLCASLFLFRQYTPQPPVPEAIKKMLGGESFFRSKGTDLQAVCGATYELARCCSGMPREHELMPHRATSASLCRRRSS